MCLLHSVGERENIMAKIYGAPKKAVITQFCERMEKEYGVSPKFSRVSEFCSNRLWLYYDWTPEILHQIHNVMNDMCITWNDNGFLIETLDYSYLDDELVAVYETVKAKY